MWVQIPLPQFNFRARGQVGVKASVCKTDIPGSSPGVLFKYGDSPVGRGSSLVFYVLQREDMKCKYCDKELKNKRALVHHEIRCHSNPDKIKITGAAVKGAMIGRRPTSGMSGKASWNKGKKGLQVAWNKGKKCLKISETMKNNPNAGGLRKGSGVGLSGWYKGYWCDSSWELAFVIYNLEHGIKFERNKKGFEYEFEGKICKYYPDFLMEDCSYVEIKGYMKKKDTAKHAAFRGGLENN